MGVTYWPLIGVMGVTYWPLIGVMGDMFITSLAGDCG